MKERPILFSGPMVRALLDGSKTQTRRVMKPQLVYGTVAGLFNSWYLPRSEGGGTLYPNGKEKILSACPYGQPGDRLWVREAWRAELTWDTTKPSGIPNEAALWYEADDQQRNNGRGTKFKGKLRPSIHMPRWASRITLEITSVRVERLQDISEADCIAEGIEKAYIDAARRQQWRMYPHDDGVPGVEVVRYVADHTLHPKESFKSLWLSINGPGSWDANPWVWCISFSRVTP